MLHSAHQRAGVPPPCARARPSTTCPTWCRSSIPAQRRWRGFSSSTLAAAATRSAARSPSSCSDVLHPGERWDVVVIGAGIGGLSCAALLAYYGLKVAVFEAHSTAGGAAHCWSRHGCALDSGTALFFGLPGEEVAHAPPSAAAAAAAHTASTNRSSSRSNSSSSSRSRSSSSSSSMEPHTAVAAVARSSRVATSILTREAGGPPCLPVTSPPPSTGTAGAALRLPGNQPGLCSSSSGSRSSASSSASASSSDNPLHAVLTLLGQALPLRAYGPEATALVFPEGTFRAQIGSELFPGVVRQLWGRTAAEEWLDLQLLCGRLAAAAVAMHPVVVRYDACVALVAGLRRPGRFVRFLASQARSSSLMGPDVMFSQLVDTVVSCAALREFLDVLCRGTSGAPAAAIPAAYMVRAFASMYSPGTQLQWPVGGPQAVVDALVAGLRHHGGKLMLRSPVAHVLVGPGGRAAGVQLAMGAAHVPASRAVVSNASVFDTQAALVPREVQLEGFTQQLQQLEPSDSFVHLHAAIDWPPPGHRSSSGNDRSSSSSSDAMQLPVHTYFMSPQLVGDTGWPTLTIATAVDDTLAPPGKQVLHAYMGEPFAPWAGLQRGSAAYNALKQARAEVLWGLIEQVVPEARACLDWQSIGTPLTHRHFRRRSRGEYGVRRPLNPFSGSGGGGRGPAAAMQPEAVQAMPGLFCVGDTTFPNVGTPAVAASGMWVANTLAPVWKHWQAANVVDSGV